MTTTTAPTTAPAAVHVIPSTPATGYGADHWHSDTVLRVGEYRHGLGWWGADGTGRLDTGGPLVRGPVAYAYGLPIVIARRPLPGDRHVDVVAEVGDVLVIGGHAYRVGEHPRSRRGEWVILTLVTR